MAMTRDQLRAARILLHLRQPELAGIALMGVATLRRYEGGQDVGDIYVDKLQRVIEEMGIVFLGEAPTEPASGRASATGATGRAAPRVGVGVALRPFDELPAGTIARLRSGPSPEENETGTPAPRKRGRPKKAVPAADAGPDAADVHLGGITVQGRSTTTPKGRTRAKPKAAQSDAG